MTARDILQIVSEVAAVLGIPVAIWAAVKSKDKAAAVYDLIRQQQLQSQQMNVHIFTAQSPSATGSPSPFPSTSSGSSAGSSST